MHFINMRASAAVYFYLVGLKCKPVEWCRVELARKMC